jgi:hypothetical protein
MLYRSTPFVLIALGLAGLNAAVHAQESAGPSPSGSISGTMLSDDAEWVVTAPSDDSLPTSYITPAGGAYEVQLVGYPTRDAMSENGALVVRFTLAGAPTEWRADNATVAYETDAAEQPFAAGAENIDLMITAFQPSDTAAAIAGDLVAILAPGGAEDLVIDPEVERLIDGNFQVTVPIRPDAP